MFSGVEWMSREILKEVAKTAMEVSDYMVVCVTPVNSHVFLGRFC